MAPMDSVHLSTFQGFQAWLVGYSFDIGAWVRWEGTGTGTGATLLRSDTSMKSRRTILTKKKRTVW